MAKKKGTGKHCVNVNPNKLSILMLELDKTDAAAVFGDHPTITGTIPDNVNGTINPFGSLPAPVQISKNKKRAVIHIFGAGTTTFTRTHPIRFDLPDPPTGTLQVTLNNDNGPALDPIPVDVVYVDDSAGCP